jgi:hypothetical protein
MKAPMSMSTLTRPIALTLALCGLLFTGCKQALNERCQITSDCEDGLVCELQGNSPAMGGVCRSTSAPPADLSVVQQPDLFRPADMASPPDGGDMGQ